MKNKENYNRLNVSQETVERDWKPSIKVGYQRNVENIDIEVSLKVGQNRKNVQTNIDEPSKPIGRRHRPDSLHSGRFNNSVYVKDTERNKMSSKAMKNEAYNRYHASSLFSHRSQKSDNLLQNSQRSVLPSYRDSGIKQILQYKHATPFRAVRLTEKCNEVPASKRQVSFSDIHQFDFRHRPQRF